MERPAGSPALFARNETIGVLHARPGIFSAPLLSPELLQWKLRDDFIETHARNRLKAELQTMPTLKGSLFSVRSHPLLRKQPQLQSRACDLRTRSALLPPPPAQLLKSCRPSKFRNRNSPGRRRIRAHER